MSTEHEEVSPLAPVSFRLSTYWKLGRGQHGLTHADSSRLALAEAIGLLLEQLSGEEAVVTEDGTVTTIVIDWSKVPPEVRDPFSFGVRR